MSVDLTRPCKYGHYENYGVNKVLFCYDGRICPKRRWCKNCANYKMSEGYIDKCKNYIAKEKNDNGKSN